MELLLERRPVALLPVLRPAFGSGEDWNFRDRGDELTYRVGRKLRPAFGSGEDWNEKYSETVTQFSEVAPGLRVGRGLELRAR